MSQNHRGNTQPQIDNEEHYSIGGLDGKGVFVFDASGNQITQFAGDVSYATKITVSGSITYVGLAAVGTAQSTAAWQCKKIDETSGVVITWADSNANFDNVATDLTSLTYG